MPSDHLLADLRRSIEGHAWHGPSVLDAVANLSAAEAGRRPVPGAHTMYELAHHIAAWMGEAASRLQGNPPGMPADGDFPVPTVAVDEAAWADVLALLGRRHAQLIDAVAGFDPTRLDDPVDPKKSRDDGGPVTYRALVSGVAQHNAYHAGQLMLLRKALTP